MRRPFSLSLSLSLSPAFDCRSLARDLNRQGYAVFDFPDRDIDEKIEGLKRDFQSRYDWEAWRAGKLDSLRIQDAWKDDARVRDIAANPIVLSLLSALYGRPAFPFQTLNFAVGTQQAAHADYTHFNSIPDRFMCGVWLAFEDVDEENGPLFYYPGSHKWPTYQNEHLGISHTEVTKGYPEYSRYVDLWERLAEHQGLKRETFCAKKGQALIWASNLVHGGSVQKDKMRSRWSQVTHYFFEGCGYTSPVANDTYNGRILFRDVVDIRTGQVVPNVINGHTVTEAVRETAKPDLMAPGPELNAIIANIARKIAVSRYKTHQDLPAEFDAGDYLEANPDLVQARADPYQHYVLFGKAEGRRLRVD